MGHAIQGSLPEGASNRLRFGLGEFKPYRYRGRKGWSPATAGLGSPLDVPCERCGVAAGQECVSLSTGEPFRSAYRHRVRIRGWQAAALAENR